MRHAVLILAAAIGVCQFPAFGQEKQKLVPAKVAPCCPPGHSFKYLDGRPIVFVANGVGGSTTLGDNLQDLNSDMHLGLRIQTVPWCRQDALYKDLVDEEAQLQAATRIACTIAAIRKDCPNVPIYLVGHSAGARVVLAAAEMSPAQSIDRVIVMAAAVSCGYDLTGVLKATRGGVDNFYSGDDGVLESAIYHATLADGTRTQAAGQVGFRAPPFVDPKLKAAYCNVRNYPWTMDFCGSGGHSAWTLRHNMKKAVVPLFCMGNVTFEPPAVVRKMPPAK
jgi:pimeloyl-ACP methyl ester carboxylesterase